MFRGYKLSLWKSRESLVESQKLRASVAGINFAGPQTFVPLQSCGVGPAREAGEDAERVTRKGVRNYVSGGQS